MEQKKKLGYEEMLEEFDKTRIPLGKLEVACGLKAQGVPFGFNNKEFEALCKLTYRAYFCDEEDLEYYFLDEFIRATAFVTRLGLLNIRGLIDDFDKEYFKARGVVFAEVERRHWKENY